MAALVPVVESRDIGPINTANRYNARVGIEKKEQRLSRRCGGSSWCGTASAPVEVRWATEAAAARGLGGLPNC